MEPIDRILACTARVFGLSSTRSGSAPRSVGADGAGADGSDAGMIECCAAEGLAAERLLREVREASMR